MKKRKRKAAGVADGGKLARGLHRAPASIGIWKRAERRHGKGSKPRGQPSTIATTICADPTPTWTIYEILSPD